MINEPMPKQTITLLDGGVGQEVNNRASHDESHPQWSVKVMLQEPEVVTQVQRDFLQAGAKVLTLNNYTATPSRMKRFDMMDQFDATHRLAVQCAQDAIAAANIARDSINIAGCLPPLAASYVTEVAPCYAQAYDEYSRLIEQQQAHVDLFLVETMSNLSELTAALDALQQHGHKAFVALTLKDDASQTLRSGQRLSDALAILKDRAAEAVMLNCCHPETVSHATDALRASALPFGAYANGFKTVEPLQPGTTVDRLEHRAELTPERYAEHAMSWIAGGATIIGGCCAIGPRHIAAMNARLEEEGLEVVKLI
jgi:homocysteine S-methyltransferase